jgi:NDP-sugar pyrophosphorylase family protein
MKALVLAGGEGKRLRPLTDDRPKPMILLNGKPLLEYILNELPDAITEIIIIVGYKGEKIREYFGSEWKGKPITYIEQKERLGTAHAVHMARQYLSLEKFFLLNADDIGDKASFEQGMGYDYCLFVAEHEDPKRFGVVELNEDGVTLKRITEKPEHPATNLVSTGSMVLSPAIFEIPLVQHPNGEHYIVDSLAGVQKTLLINVIRQKSWITVTFPEDVQKTEGLLKKMGK